MKTISLRDKIEKNRKELMAELGIKNVMAAPRITKVVVSSGTGKAKDKKRNELVANRLTQITGQKTSMNGAKKSIATFKVREGDIVGVSVTLRGDRMYGFLDKLINVAIPRMRDFKGYDTKAIDNMGNLSIGMKEHTVFPETADEELKDVFGLAVTVVTTSKDKKTTEAFLRAVGFPFKK